MIQILKWEEFHFKYVFKTPNRTGNIEQIELVIIGDEFKCNGKGPLMPSTASGVYSHNFTEPSAKTIVIGRRRFQLEPVEEWRVEILNVPTHLYFSRQRIPRIDSTHGSRKVYRQTDSACALTISWNTPAEQLTGNGWTPSMEAISRTSWGSDYACQRRDMVDLTKWGRNEAVSRQENRSLWGKHWRGIFPA